MRITAEIQLLWRGHRHHWLFESTAGAPMCSRGENHRVQDPVFLCILPLQNLQTSQARNLPAEISLLLTQKLHIFVFRMFFLYKAYSFTQNGNETALLFQWPSGAGTDLRNLMSLWHSEATMQ